MPNRSRLSDVLQHADSPADVFDSTSNRAPQEPQPAGARVQHLPIDDVAISSYQIRQTTGSHELEALADSITSKGVLQPLLVRAIKPDSEREESFELIAGERRLRAAAMAGLTHVPALIVALDDRETLEAAIIENAQRENLNAIEEARAFKRLADEFALTQREIAEAVGKSRVTISNALRLLQLDHRVVEFIADGHLSAGHGRALLMLDGERLQFRFARRAIAQQLSVHVLEKSIAAFLERAKEEPPGEEEEKERVRVERQRKKVADCLGLEQVGMSFDSQGRRRVNLVFDTEAAWKRFMGKIRD